MAIGIDAPVYLARRFHPEAGAIVKVGRSITPQKRCRDLGARLAIILPAGLERELLAAFRPWRVWTRNGRIWHPGDCPEPILNSQTEWFYDTGAVAAFLHHCASPRPECVPVMQDARAWLNQAISTERGPCVPRHGFARGAVVRPASPSLGEGTHWDAIREPSTATPELSR